MTSTAPPQTAAQVAQVAGQAALTAAASASLEALTVAAANAAKPGGQTTEFKAMAGTIALGALVAGLKAASVIPGPWMLPALIITATITVASGAYSISRGNVKAAALAGAAAAVQTAFPRVVTPAEASLHLGG